MMNKILIILMGTVFTYAAATADESKPQTESSTKVEQAMPTGTIVAYWGEKAPDGWLLCDGNPIAENHTALKELVGEKTPDLRGMFLRGANMGRKDKKGDAVDRKIGSYQKDQLADHKHSMNLPTYNSDRSGVKDTSFFVTTEAPKSTVKTSGVKNAKKGQQTQPRNIAVNWIIKY